MLNMRKFFENNFFVFYIVIFILIGIICFNSCSSNKKDDNVVIDSLKKETKYLLQDLSLTRTSYNKTIVENDLLRIETKKLKQSIQELKKIKKSSSTIVKGKDIDSTQKDSSFVPIKDYTNLSNSYDSLSIEFDSCLFYANYLLYIVDKKDKIIAKKDSLNTQQNKDFDKILEINDELLKQEYKKGIRKGRKQGIIFGWFTGLIGLIGINAIK